MNDQPALQAEKRGTTAYPWTVAITAGPWAGLGVGLYHRRKTDAVAWIERHKHLPWHQVQHIAEAADSRDVLVTVPREEIAATLFRLKRLEAELAACRAVLLQVNGSAMMLDEARKVAAEKASTELDGQLSLLGGAL